MEGKPQTNTEKREEKHKQQDKRAKSAEVHVNQIWDPYSGGHWRGDACRDLGHSIVFNPFLLILSGDRWD